MVQTKILMEDAKFKVEITSKVYFLTNENNDEEKGSELHILMDQKIP
jgi:YHS domain-containing protein